MAFQLVIGYHFLIHIQEAYRSIGRLAPPVAQNELEIAFGESGIPLQYIDAYRLVDDDGFPVGDWVPFSHP